MEDLGPFASLPEARRSELIRAVDWRFLLRRSRPPRILDLTSGHIAEALPFVGTEADPEPASADVVLLGFPTRRGLRRARTALAPGGEVVCLWRRPRIAGLWRARMRLRRARFDRTSFHWPGPWPHRLPQYWLPVGAPGAAAWVFGREPPRSPLEAAMRRLWRPAERIGVLAPLCAIGGTTGQSDDGETLDVNGSLALLTAGASTSDKVIGIPFENGSVTSAIVKVGRMPGADEALERERRALLHLADDLPQIAGVPRLRAAGRLAGRHAIAQTAIHGEALSAKLTGATLDDLTSRVCDRLAELTGEAAPRPVSEWHRRLVAEPLERFERCFASKLERGAIDRLTQALADLPDLPLVIEHRDCGTWNIAITPSGEIAIHDWEFAEPQGLPGCDVAFFLSTAALDIDDLLATPAPDPKPVLDSHLRHLDPSTPSGQVVTRRSTEYCGRIGLDADTFTRLRLLGWVTQALAGRRKFELELAGEPVDDPLRSSILIRLLEAELRLFDGGR